MVEKLDKETVGKIISAVVTLIITVLSLFGYHVVVVQPQLAAMASLVELVAK